MTTGHDTQDGPPRVLTAAIAPPSSPPFLHLSILSNWGYWDQLDGVTLEDGEALEVRWPDGSITRELITLKRSTFETYDHGHRCDCSRVEALVMVEAVAGLKAPIRLIEHDIKARRLRADELEAGP